MLPSSSAGKCERICFGYLLNDRDDILCSFSTSFYDSHYPVVLL